MRVHQFLAIFAQYAIALGQLTHLGASDLALRNFTVIREGPWETSSVSDSSPVSSNDTINLEAQTISFNKDGFTYIGRIADRGNFPEPLSSLIEDLLLRHLQAAARQFSTFSFGSRYFYSAKVTLTIPDSSSMWSINELVSMVTSLRDYLQQHDSRNSLHVTVASPEGLRAIVKVEHVSAVVTEVQYEAPGSDVEEKFSLVWFNNDRIDRDGAVAVMQQLFRWSQSEPVGQAIRPNTVQSAVSDDTELVVSTLPTVRGTEDIVYGSIKEVLSFIFNYGENVRRGQWSACQVMLETLDKQVQGQILLHALPPGSQSRLRPGLDDINGASNRTITDVTEVGHIVSS